MKPVCFLIAGLCFFSCPAQSYPPEAGQAGSTAIFRDSPQFVAWASGISVERGAVNLSDPGFTASGSNLATAGSPDNALGFPNGDSVSLGDGGWAVLTFDQPITNGPGFDFAVFENGSVSYLELAFVEVSSDGTHFVRFPAHSQTQTDSQIGTFGSPSAPYLHHLAGKYDGLHGTPFDLDELPEDPLLDKQEITHVRILDVVGSVNPQYATYDSLGNAVNDSFPTPFASAGFDLQAVGVIHELPLSVGDQSEEQVGFFPNPASHRITFSPSAVARVLVRDSHGRRVLERHLPDNQLEVSQLLPGMYFLEVGLQSGKQAVLKLFKN